MVAGSLQQFIYIFYEKRYALEVSPSVAEREPRRILPSDRSTGFYTESALDDLLILTVLAVVHPSVPVSARGTLSVIVQLVVVILTRTALVVGDKALLCLSSVFVFRHILTAYRTRLPTILTRALSVSASLTSVLRLVLLTHTPTADVLAVRVALPKLTLLVLLILLAVILATPLTLLLLLVVISSDVDVLLVVDDLAVRVHSDVVRVVVVVRSLSSS